MKQKLAKKSFGKEPYVCQKPWPEDCFCQCGGDGIVFVSPTKDPSETNKPPENKNYRTSFFEAFPKSPKCFIRGEGDFVEEAEARAFEKFQKILSCTNHEWDRRGRTDGYCYCSKCPLTGMYLEPLTKCSICQVPTARYTNKDDIQYCRNHYFELSADEVIDDKEWFGMTPEEQKMDYLVDQSFFQQLIKMKPNLNEDEYQKMQDLLIHVQAELNAKFKPLFGPPTKTNQELHEMIMKDLPSVAEVIFKKVTGVTV